MTRKQFERFIAAPPYERSIARFSTDEQFSAWPGQYADLVVQRIWEVLQEAERLAREEKPDTKS